MNINEAINKANSQRGQSFYKDIVNKYVQEKPVVEQIYDNIEVENLISLDIKDHSIIDTPKDNGVLFDRINKLNNNFEKILKKLEDLERKETVFNKIKDFEKRYEQISLRIELLLSKFNINDDIFTNMNKLNTKFDKLNSALSIAEKLSEFDSKITNFNDHLDNLI